MPELLYQVDEQDTVLGPIERKEAHKNLRLHRSGMVFIANSKGQIFIQNRAKTETFPDCYDSSSAFHIKFGESYEEAAHRELFEETAIKTELRLIGKFMHNNPPEYELVGVFLGHSDQTPKLDPKEAYSGEWSSPEQVRQFISSGKTTPWLRDGFKLLEKHLLYKQLNRKKRLYA